MKLKQYIKEKKSELTGNQHKDYFLKKLNQWDTDISKLTKAYKSLKAPNRMEFYEKNELNNYQLKKDFMKHPDMKNFLMLKNAFRIFSTNFEKWIYTQILDPKKVKQEDYYQRMVRETAWAFFIDISIGSLFPDDYDNVSGRHVPAPWDLDYSGRNNSRKQNITRYQGRWRKFKEAFTELIQAEANEIDKATEDEQIQVAGFNILIKNKGKDNDKNIKTFIDSLRDIKTQLKKNGLDKVLRDLSIELNFNVASEPSLYSRYGDMIGGAYDPQKDKLYIFPLGIDRKISDNTLIHELAHRYWFKFVPPKAKQAWKEKFEQQRVTVTNDHLKKFFDMYFREDWGFPSRKELVTKIEKDIDDPTTKIIFDYLSKNTPIFDPKEGETRYDRYWEFYQGRSKGQEIPLEWITDYARTNEKESFADAFKLWIGGVKGKLGPWTRAFFKEIVRTGGVSIKEEIDLIDKYLGGKNGKI